MAVILLATGGCYDGLDDADEDALADADADELAANGEGGPTSTVTCDPTMHVFPVGDAHNIGYDEATCAHGCAISCPDQNANSDWSAATGHHGIDIFAYHRAPLVAVTDAVVQRVGVPSKTSGMRVRLRDACGWEYYYGHLEADVPVSEGEWVKAGQVIGYMGSSGAASVHLHFNVSPGGDYNNDINPFELLKATSPTACGGAAAEPPPPEEPPPEEPPPPAEPPVPPPAETCGALVPGEVLWINEGLTSCDGRFTLLMQDDGNLVAYHNGVGALWHTNTHGRASDALVMQDDGNLVIYDVAGAAVWHTGTHGNPGAWLAMQDDGNVVIYRGSLALWNSGTAGH